MWKKKSAAKIEAATSDNLENPDNKEHKDLIIHNMPNPARAGQSSSTHPLSQGFALSSPPVKNFKLAGMIIIFGGLAVIGVLIFLSYYFIIHPAADSPVNVAPSSAQEQTPTLASTSDEFLSEELSEAVKPLDITDLLAEDSLLVDLAEEGKALDGADLQDDLGSPPLLDSDNDGLNDLEEEVFGTDPLNSDTDGDGYSDTAELLAGYSPLGPGLAGEDILARASNNLFNYQIAYPAAWPLQRLNNDLTFMISLPDGSLIQIIAQENYNRLPIISWYQESFPDVRVSYDNLQRGNGWEGIMSADGTNFYLTDDYQTKILIASYISVDGSLSYPFIFSLIINSINFISE